MTKYESLNLCHTYNKAVSTTHRLHAPGKTLLIYMSFNYQLIRSSELHSS